MTLARWYKEIKMVGESVAALMETGSHCRHLYIFDLSGLQPSSRLLSRSEVAAPFFPRILALHR